MAGRAIWNKGQESTGKGAFGGTVQRLSQMLTIRQLLLALFLLALAVRLLHLLSILPTPLVTYHLTFPASDMYDFDQWARRIVKGDVLGREIFQPLHRWQLAAAPAEAWMQWYGGSPVFFKAPLYPYVLALQYWLFGEALLPVVLLQILSSSLSAVLLCRISEHLLDRTSGLVAGLLYALYAPGIHYDVFLLRSSFIVLISLVVTLQLIQLRAASSVRRTCILGLTLGAALLLNEGFLLLLPLVVVLLACWLPNLRRFATLGAGLLLGFGVMLSPLLTRNWMVSAPLFRVGALGSTIIASSNAADVDPYFFRGAPPSFASTMHQSGGRLLATVWAALSTFQGDIGAIGLFYLRKAAGLVIPFETPDNSNFYYAALKGPLLRILPNYTWLFPMAVVGLATAARKARMVEAILPVALSLLLGMMIAHPNSRFRTTLVVYLMPFAGWAMVWAARCIRRRTLFHLGTGVIAALLVAFACGSLQQRVVFRGLPADAFQYRRSEFWVGAEVYAREKRFPEATEEVLQLARHNPDLTTQIWALLMAAKFQVDAGGHNTARQLLDLAVRMNGDDAALLMEVGDFHWRMLGDIPQAILYYRRAMSSHPADTLDSALRERLEFLKDGLPAP